MREGVVVCPSLGRPHRLAYFEWGEARAPVVICVHGLTGSGRDFDELAEALVRAGYRVLCPDLVGRGSSQRLADPSAYRLGQYVADLEQLLSALELGDIDWIGTSLGGLVGMTLAARPAARVRRLVLNDVGPWVPAGALARIGEHLGEDPWFEDLDAASAYLRRVRAGSGRLTDVQWRRMTERAVRTAQEGGYRLHYDPSLALRYRATSLRDLDVWDTWEALTCPVLVLRGSESDFLLEETTREMARRGPGATIVEIEGCGHPPPLMDPAQFRPIMEWLGPPAGSATA